MPQKNGIVERMNKNLLERTRNMLSHFGLDIHYWIEVVCALCYLVNRSLSTSIIFKIPVNILSGKLVDNFEWRVFGCPTYYYVDNHMFKCRSRECLWRDF